MGRNGTFLGGVVVEVVVVRLVLLGVVVRLWLFDEMVGRVLRVWR